MLKLGRVTKVKVLFLVLVFVFLILAFSNVFEFSAAILEKGRLFVNSRPKNNLQLLFVKTVLNFTVVFYVEFRLFKFIDTLNKRS